MARHTHAVRTLTDMMRAAGANINPWLGGTRKAVRAGTVHSDGWRIRTLLFCPAKKSRGDGEKLAPLKINHLFFTSPRQPALAAFLQFTLCLPVFGGEAIAKMASDEIIWQIINQQFCAFKLK